jgi:hypothetical protein
VNLDHVQAEEANSKTAASPAKQRWDTGTYLTIRSARYENGALRVGFANGEEVSVPVDRLPVPRSAFAGWSSVAVGPLWISVPTSKGDIEVSWLADRLATDPQFRAQWERRAEDYEQSAIAHA